MMPLRFSIRRLGGLWGGRFKEVSQCAPPVYVGHIKTRAVGCPGSRYYTDQHAYSLSGEVSSPMYGVVDRSGSADIAISSPRHQPVAYTGLYMHAASYAQMLADSVHGRARGCQGAHPPCVAVLCSNGFRYVAAQWACWSLGHVFVPLSSLHPDKMLEYFLNDSSAFSIMFDKDHEGTAVKLAKKFNIPSISLAEAIPTWDSPLVLPESVSNWSKRPAILMYTSGTTGPPKGVPISHGGLCAGIRSIADAWEMNSTDTVLHCLPLHHVHGVVNALATPLAMGARVHMLPKFDAEQVWHSLLGVRLQDVSRPAELEHQPTMFMAVPTMYAKLAKFAADSHLSPAQQEAVVERCRNIRVMISGSAPLPDPVLQNWERLTGHRLLERYGMTEIQMGLTNPLHGNRIPGAVGQPFPGVDARIVDADGKVLVTGKHDGTLTRPDYSSEQGELQIKGPTVFDGYWKKPEATKKSFTEDGWFLTGDTAMYENEVYRIVGRTSVDIIKSGGYKISALDVERCLLAHPRVADCAVIGLPDSTYGEVVTAVIVLEPADANVESNEEPSLKEFSDFVKESLPPYVAPRQLRLLKDMPRNAMGKVNKKELAKAVASQ